MENNPSKILNDLHYTFEQPKITLKELSYTLKSNSKSYTVHCKNNFFREIFERIIGVFIFFVFLIGLMSIFTFYINTINKLIADSTLTTLIILAILIIIFVASFLLTSITGRFITQKRILSLIDCDKNIVFKIIPTSRLFIFSREYQLLNAENILYAVYKTNLIKKFGLTWHCYDSKNNLLLISKKIFSFSEIHKKPHYNFFDPSNKLIAEYKADPSKVNLHNLNINQTTDLIWMIIGLSICIDMDSMASLIKKN